MTAEQTSAEHMADRLFNQSIVVMEAAAVWLGQRLDRFLAPRRACRGAARP
jgi:hypothetical protein